MHSVSFCKCLVTRSNIKLQTSIISLYTYNKHIKKFAPILKRPQLEALAAVKSTPMLSALMRSRKKNQDRIPKMPAISFSLLDSFIG